MTGKSGNFDVIGLGHACVDDISVLPRFPGPDEKVRASERLRVAGGQVANCLVGLARLGLGTAYVGCIGDDQDGVFILEELVREGVDIRGLQIARGQTSHQASVWITEDDTRRSVAWHRAEDLKIDPDRLSPSLISSCKLFHVDGHDPASAEAARVASEEGIHISVDAEEVYPFTEDLLEVTDLLMADQEFPAKLGLEGSGTDVLDALASYGPRLVAVTRGTDGAIALADNERYEIPRFDVDAVDTTGAGDAFRAGVIFGYLHGWDWGQMLRAGAVVAGLSTRSIGGREGLPSLDELLEYLDLEEGAIETRHD